MTSARSASGLMGRPGPLLARTDRSELTPDDERVAERAGGLEVADVPGVEQVVHAVGEDDDFAGLCAAPATSATPSSSVVGTYGHG